MSITNHNGSVTITSFAELGEVIDRQSLAPEPDASERPDMSTESQSSPRDIAALAGRQDLASLLAQLASVSSGIERMTRQDAHAREQAALELAQYESLTSERQDAERALVELQRVRTAAEQLAAQAFTDEARLEAAQHVATARTAELALNQLLADRTRALDELEARPYVARAIADRRLRAEQEAQQARRAEAERTARLNGGLAAVNRALGDNDLDEAQRALAPVFREFPDNPHVRRLADRLRWLLQHRLVAPAEEALQELARRPFREDPERAILRLASLDIGNLPEELARRVFGLWTNACYRVVEQRGWHDPKRYAPFTSHGIVIAQPAPGEPETVVSSLGLPDWKPGDVVQDVRILRAARPLEPQQQRGK
jgi:hypothetical protein